MSFKGLEDAIKALQFSAKAAGEAMVSLTALTNPDWEEWEHPRGLDGRFVHKLNGMYIYGFNKKATFTNSTGSKVSVKLQPGDKLYAYSGGAGTKIIQNADGKVGVVDSKTGLVAKWLDASSWIEKNMGKLTLVDQSKGIETKTPDAKGLAEATGSPIPDKATPKPKLGSKGVHNFLPVATKKGLTEAKTEQEAAKNVSVLQNLAKEISSEADMRALETLVHAYQTKIPENPNATGHPHAIGKKFANLSQGQLDALGETRESIDERFDALADLHDLLLSIENQDPGQTFMPVSEELQMSPMKFLRYLVDSYRDDREAQGENLTPGNVLYGVTEDPNLVAEGAKLVEGLPEAPATPSAASKVPQMDTSYTPPAQKAGAGTKAPENVPDNAKAEKVITTKAGPPFGSGVWITPDLTDALGKPYKMSGQGEKSKYWIFPSYAQPHTLTNSKGQKVDGLDPALAIPDATGFENKKAAKAWLATNAASAKEAMFDTEEPKVTPPDTTEPVKSLQEVLQDSIAQKAAQPVKKTVPDYTPQDTVLKNNVDSPGVFNGAYVVSSDGVTGDIYLNKPDGVEKWGDPVSLSSLNMDAWDTIQSPAPEPVVSVPSWIEAGPADEVWVRHYGTNGILSQWIVKHPDGSGQKYLNSGGNYPITADVVDSSLNVTGSLEGASKYYKIKEASTPDSGGIPDAVKHNDEDAVYQSQDKTAWLVVKPNGVAEASNVMWYDNGLGELKHLVGPFNVNESSNWNLFKPAVEPGTLAEAPKSLPTVNFTKSSKIGETINWNVLGVSDPHGENYLVTSQNGEFRLFDSLGNVVTDSSGSPVTFAKAKEMKAWLAQNAASETIGSEEGVSVVDAPDTVDNEEYSTVSAPTLAPEEKTYGEADLTPVPKDLTDFFKPDPEGMWSYSWGTRMRYSVSGFLSLGDSTFVADAWFTEKDGFYINLINDDTGEVDLQATSWEDVADWLNQNAVSTTAEPKSGNAFLDGLNSMPVPSHLQGIFSEDGPSEIDKLSGTFIAQEYKVEGYKTAYGEDIIAIHGYDVVDGEHTFNLYKNGAHIGPGNADSWDDLAFWLDNNALKDWELELLQGTEDGTVSDNALSPSPEDDLEVDESPSKENPTPGSPASYKAVAVTGYKVNGKTVPGTYTTKNHMDEFGSPYFITSNGLPNNWEIWHQSDVASFNTASGTWNFKTGAKPVGVYSQLKEAKGAIAAKTFDAPQMNTGPDGSFTIVSGNGVYFTSKWDTVLHSPDHYSGETYAVFSGHGNYMISDGMVSNIYGDTVASMKKEGWTVVQKPAALSDDAYLPAPEGYDSTQTPESQGYKSFDWLDNGYEVFNYTQMPKYDFNTAYYMTPASQTLEEMKPGLQEFVDVLNAKETQLKKWLGYVEELKTATTYGSIKTAITKAKNRFKAMHAGKNIAQSILNGEDVNEEDLKYIDKIGDTPFNASGNGNYSEHSTLTRIKLVGQIALNIQKAKADGFDVKSFSEITPEDLTTKHGGIYFNSPDEVAKVQAFAGESGAEYSGFIDDEHMAAQWLAAKYMQNISTQMQVSAKAAKKAAMEKTTLNLKKYIEEAKQAPIGPSTEVKNKSLKTYMQFASTMGLEKGSFDFKAAHDILPAEVFVQRLWGGNTIYALYGYNVNSEQYELTNDYGYFGQPSQGSDPKKEISVAEISALLKLGVADQKGSKQWEKFSSVDPAAFIDLGAFIDPGGIGNGKPALWKTTVEDMQALVAPDMPTYAAYAVSLKNPLFASLFPMMPTNPYVGLANDDLAWGVTFHKVMENQNIKEWVESEGGIDLDGNEFESAFGVDTGNPDKGWLVKFANDYILPKLLEQAKKYDFETSAENLQTNGGKKGVPSKPSDVSDASWALALAVYKKDDFFPPAQGYYNSTKNAAKKDLSPVDLANLDENLFDKVASFASQHSNEFPEYSTFSQAFNALAKAGVFRPETNKATLTHKSKTAVFHLLPGDKVYGYDGYGAQFMVVHHGGNGYKVNISGNNIVSYETLTAQEVKDWSNSSYGYVSDKPIHVNPVNMDFKLASSEVADLTPEAFSMWETNFNNDSFADVYLPGMDGLNFGDTLISLKQAMAQKPADYEKISEIGIANLPKGAAKLLHYGVLENNPAFIELANLYAKYQMLGDAPGEEHVGSNWIANLDSSKPYYDYLLNGTAVELWPTHALNMAGKDFLGTNYYDSPDDYSEFVEKVQTYIDSQGTNAGEKAKQAKATSNVPTLYPADFNAHGGSHSIGTWADENGNQWISKEFPSDSNSKARIEAEHYAMEIGRLFGFNPPASAVMTLPNGKYAYAQHFAPAKSDLSSYGWNDIPEKVMHSIMEQHVYDWVISNHDSHGGNILLTEDGQDAFPIDRGQAFRFFGEDKLAVGYLPSTNPVPVWYDKVYNAVKSGSMTKEQADRVRDAVIRKAALVSVRNNEAYRENIEAALANRDNFPYNFPTRDAFIEGLMQRKASTFDDFTKLWKGIYQKAGYSYDAPTDIDSWLPKQLGHAHVSVSPDFTADISKAQASGIPLFFGGTELDNGHMQFYVSKGKDGSDTLRVETRLRSDAANALQNWLSNQTVEKGSTAPVADPYNYNSNYVDPTDTDEYKMKQLPGLMETHNQLVAFVITVGSHLKSKNGEPPDYKFNESTVKSAQQALKNLKYKVAVVENHIASDEGYLTYDGNIYDGKFYTMEQQDSWLSQAKTMIDNFEIVQNAMDTKIPVSQSHPDLVPFTEPVYNPSPNLKTSDNKELVSGYILDGVKYQKFSDGSYVIEGTDGVKAKSNKEEFEAVSASKDAVPMDVKPKEVVEAWTYQDEGSGGYITFKKYSDDTYAYSYESEGVDHPSDGADFSYVVNKAKNGETMAGGAEITQVKIGAAEDIAAATEEEAVVTSGTKILKITHKKASSFLGQYDPETNTLKDTGKSFDQLILGNEYEIQFEGITIKFQAAKDLPAKAYAQHNLMRISIDSWDGGTQQIDSLIEVMRSMGLELPEADETAMELMYWRQLTGVLRNRKLNPKQKKLKDRLAKEISPGMTRDAELAKFREIYSSTDGFGDLSGFISQRGYLPRIALNNQGVRAGRPNWFHPNVDFTELKKKAKGKLMNHNISYGGDTSKIPEIVKSGYLLSTEERLRLLGKPLSGASSSTDQASKGSSQGVFTRIGEASDYSVLMDPSVYYRISNYGLEDDAYGDADAKKTSPFSPADMAEYYTNYGYHEVMIKDAISFAEDVAVTVVGSNAMLNAILKFYKDLGITEIRGIPIEERFVQYTSQAEKTIEKVWKLWEEKQKSGKIWEAIYNS